MKNKKRDSVSKRGENGGLEKHKNFQKQKKDYICT